MDKVFILPTHVVTVFKKKHLVNRKKIFLSHKWRWAQLVFLIFTACPDSNFMIIERFTPRKNIFIDVFLKLVGLVRKKLDKLKII